jgi:hypothetical protein
MVLSLASALQEVYGVSRSFKRGAIIMSTEEAGVKQSDVEFMVWWRAVEWAAGRTKPGQSIWEHYRELVQMLDARLFFESSLNPPWDDGSSITMGICKPGSGTMEALLRSGEG